MYNVVRIDVDPTSWELSTAVEGVSTSGGPVVLPVSHPLVGNLVLSPRSAGSVVLLDYPVVYGTRPNGAMIGEQSIIYLPSPTGLDLHSNPPNFYFLASPVDLARLEADITRAMTDGTFVTVKIRLGEVVISGADVPFVVLCPPNPG